MKMMKETYISVTSKPGYHLHDLQQLKARLWKCLAMVLIT